MNAPEDLTPQEGDEGFPLVSVLEAMMFASNEPLTIEEIRAALPDLDPVRIEATLTALGRILDQPERGLKLEKVAGGFRLVTRPELAASLRALFRFRNQKRLTPATLDVLAIIAYAQPITAPEIQEIRGTDPTYALKTLMERTLVRIVGRKRIVGRPILYGTTREFLLHFGLDSLEDLPPVEGFGTRVVASQGRLFPVTQKEEILPAGAADGAGEEIEPVVEDTPAGAAPGDAEGAEDQPAAGGDPEPAAAGLKEDPPPPPDVETDSAVDREPDQALENPPSLDREPEPAGEDSPDPNLPADEAGPTYRAEDH